MNHWVVDGFAVIGVVACARWLLQLARATVEQQTKATPAVAPAPALRPAAAAVPSPSASGEPSPEEVAVIAGAVMAAIGCCRIVHIERAPHGEQWVAEGRWIHQTSHRPVTSSH